jgi:hypothetical protein
MRAVHVRDHQATNSLYDRIRLPGDPPERIEQFFAAAEAARARVRNPSSFRPSAGKPEFLIARLWRLMSETPPNKATSVGAAFAQALALDDSGIAGSTESVFGVLNRPTAPDARGTVRFARNLLHVVRMSCQLTTAAAHADDYPAFSFALQCCISMDLRKSLNDAVGICERSLQQALVA